MDWKKSTADSAVNNMVFLDESGVNTNMARHYACALKEKRAVDSAPVNTPTNTTILSPIQLNGETAHIAYQGGISAERFAEYLETTLLPGLSENDIVIMDNMRSHHAKLVKKALEDKHIHYLYLPPYSPDLNPMEKIWPKIKAFLRKRKEQNALNLPKAIE